MGRCLNTLASTLGTGMPFTAAHPAAIVPLARGPLLLSALVAGSLAPDVPYYLYDLPHPVSARFTHTWTGSLLADVPLALVIIAGLYVVAAPAAALAPTPLRGRLAAVLPRRSWLSPWLPVSAWLGALTHVAWDMVTHERGARAPRGAGLRGAGVDPLHQALQHGSTVLGLAVLAIVLVRWYRHATHPAPPPGLSPAARIAVLAAASLVVAGAAVTRGATALTAYAPEALIRGLLTRVAEGAVVGAVLVLLGYSLAWWAIRLARNSVPRH